MAEEREHKRVRQACANCRRKKTRCSGERPVCAFCARLGQTCRYIEDSSSEFGTSPSTSVLQQENLGLAARVALLESRLSMLDAYGSEGASLFGFGGSPSQQLHPSDAQQDNSTLSIRDDGIESDFASLLDTGTLQSLADTYFRYCHQQPYSYFHEETFRRDLESRSLPSYLLLAFAATAVRFSSDRCFTGRQVEATDWYSRMAWSEIVEQSFSDAHSLNIRTVQAANMLGVADYVAGRNQLAWVKIGLSIRFAQTLQLGKEPDQLMPLNESEERRHTFWSVYLLDRLVSCGRNRPPALLDTDCTIRLPSRPYSFRKDSNTDPPTLAAIHDIPDKALLEKTDHFALTIFMVSVLGYIVRWAFKHSAAEPRLPWDSRSEFARINGILLSFESYSDACNGNFADILDQHVVCHGSLDEGTACHFAYSHILYHVNQCLLHHPFLLRQHLGSCKVKVPVGFLRGAVLKSREHAVHLSDILRILQQRGCKTYPSFYGYAAILAGVIHRLHSRSERTFEKQEAEARWELCLRFLDQEPVRWESYRRMSTVLREFDPTPTLATKLLSSALDPSPLEPEIEETLWQICDYSWLANSARPTSKANDISPSVTKIPEFEMTIPRSGHTPDFEMLLGGALSLDYSLLDNARGDISAGAASDC